MGLQITKKNYNRWAWQRIAVTDFHFDNSKFQVACDPIQVGRVNFKKTICDWILTPGYIIAYHLAIYTITNHLRKLLVGVQPYLLALNPTSWVIPQFFIISIINIPLGHLISIVTFISSRLCGCHLP